MTTNWFELGLFKFINLTITGLDRVRASCLSLVLGYLTSHNITWLPPWTSSIKLHLMYQQIWISLQRWHITIYYQIRNFNKFLAFLKIHIKIMVNGFIIMIMQHGLLQFNFCFYPCSLLHNKSFLYLNWVFYLCFYYHVVYVKKNPHWSPVTFLFSLRDYAYVTWHTSQANRWPNDTVTVGHVWKFFLNSFLNTKVHPVSLKITITTVL